MSKLQITAVFQGDSVKLPFEALDAKGAPENLDGCSIRWALRVPPHARRSTSFCLPL